MREISIFGVIFCLGYVRAFQFLFLLTCMFNGVGGAIWMYICGICIYCAIVVSSCICSKVPISWFRWWIQRIWIVAGSICGLFILEGMVGLG